MLKNRRFLMGMGLGVILGSIMLQLMLWSGAGERDERGSLFDEPTPQTGVRMEPLTEEQVREEAKRLNLQVVPGDQTYLTEQEANQQAKEAVEGALREAAAEGDVPMVKAMMITPGMTRDDVAELLLEIGLIRSKLEFNAAMDKLDLNGNIQTGAFIFPAPLEPDELIKVLTTPR